MELIRKYTTIHIEKQSFAYFPNGTFHARMIEDVRDVVDGYLGTSESLREYTPEMERQALQQEVDTMRQLTLEQREEMLDSMSEQQRTMENNRRQQIRRAELRAIEERENLLDAHMKSTEKIILLCNYGIVLCCILIALGAILTFFDVFEYPYGTLLIIPQFMFVFQKKKSMDFKLLLRNEQYQTKLERFKNITQF